MHRAFKASLAVAAIAIGPAIVLPGLAQQAAPAASTPMPGMTAQPAPSTAVGSDAEASMMAAMEKMSQTMAAVPMTGNSDRDFVAMMIPHHQGAIDMARFELAHGKDPAMRKLAQDIVGAQETEIAEMQAWQKAHPGTP